MTNLPRTDFDTPWKDILENLFSDFMHFFFPNIAHAIDWQKPFEFLDTELRKLTPESQSQALSVDKLVKVYLLNGQELWMIIHIEIQSQVDERFTYRMYVYNYRASDFYKKPILSLAILSDDNKAWRPHEFNQEIFGCKTGITFPMVKLIDFEHRLHELENSSNPFGIITLAHLTALRTKKDINTRFNTKLSLVRLLYNKGFSKEKIREIFIFIDWVITLPRPIEIEYYQQVQDIRGEQTMAYVSNFEKHYTAIGFQAGQQEGLIKGEMTVLLRLLKSKFKTLPEHYQNYLSNATSEHLLTWSERVLFSQTLEEVFEGTS